jgi:parallel beta-helix repeat protein
LETEDTGAIYSGGRNWTTPRGTRIAYNFIHDIPGFSMHGGKPVSPNFAWGIYLDDNSGGADVIGNIVARCGRGGMHGHGARDCVVRNNIFVGNNDWQVDFHGWMVQQSFWERHLPTMAAGYEAVAGKPAWKEMRGMDVHPSEVPLPGGFTMRGNVFEKNIVVSDKADVPVLSILRVPFTHNTFNSNLYWAPGGVVRTGFKSAGPDLGADLLSAFEGTPDSLPKGWRWNTKPGGQPKVGVNAGDSAARFVISCDDAPDKKVQPVLSGPDIQLEPGATYRLRARLRATLPGKASIGVHSYVSKVYYWLSPKAEVEVGGEWTEKEWVFEVPSPGKPGWNDQMKNFAPRIGWRVNNGALEVESMRLHKVEPVSEWDSWKANGVDALSLVADPQWADSKLFTLKPESPAWKLGFERIPVEKIGPQPKSTGKARGL